MSYNNVFPISYQPYQQTYAQQYQQHNQNQQVQTSSNLIWVQGEAGAKSYLVAPNQTVQLWDSETQTIYLKSADAVGMPSIKILDYTIRNDTPNSPKNSHSERESINNEIDIIKSKIDALESNLSEIRALTMNGGNDNE